MNEEMTSLQNLFSLIKFVSYDKCSSILPQKISDCIPKLSHTNEFNYATKSLNKNLKYSKLKRRKKQNK